MSYSKYSDYEYWMRHIMTTDLRYQTERGNAFAASDRWVIAGNSSDHLELRIPEDITVRVYERMNAVEGNAFDIDLCSVDSIVPGNTELIHTNMKLGSGKPQSRIWRGATSPVNLVVRESTYLPAASTGSSSGGLAELDAYRLMQRTDPPSILRITNTEAGDKIFNLIILFTEVAE